MLTGARSDAETKNQTSMELRGEREIVLKRLFNGPPRVVFEVWTREDLVRRWWAPKSRGVEMASCEADVRVDGRYRYVLRRGVDELAFSGRYLEVDPPSRLVYTQVFEPMAKAGEAIITVTFEEHGTKTLLTAVESYPSREVRDGVVSSGMEDGMRESMDQLDEVVATFR